MVRSSTNIIVRYAESKGNRFHAVLATLSFVSFILIIALGFAPVSGEIESNSGYSTMDLQSSETRSDVDAVLTAFEPVMDLVTLLSVLDYLFIVAGFLLFTSLNSLFLRTLQNHSNPYLSYVPQVGVLLTILSRSLDSLENFWVILIYTNPDSYPTLLIPLMNISETLKWGVVGLEYSTMVLGLVLTVLILALNRSTQPSS